MPYDGIYFSACLASYIVLMDKDKKVLLMRRTNTGWGDGYYNVPAGKVERGETFLETAVRETYEECGITVEPQDLRLFLVHNRHDETQQPKTLDWVDMFFVADKWSGEAKIMEPEKSDAIGWFYLDELPEKIVSNIADALHYLKDDEKLSFGLLSADHDFFKKKVA